MSYARIKAILVLDRRLSSTPARKIVEGIDCQLVDVEEFLTDIEAYDRALYTELAVRELDVVLLDPSLPSAFLMKAAMRVRDKLPSLPVLILPHPPAARSTLLVADAIRHVCNREQLNSRLLQLALKDELTSLHSRRGFTMLADQQLRVARDMRRSLLLFFADVDGLKKINDTLGHQAGDEALILAARCFRKSFRNADVIGRIGGDEFVALTAEESNSSLAASAQEFNAARR